jgi:uracil-DNA glycosylase family 4
MPDRLSALDALEKRIVVCHRCPRLAIYRKHVARERKRAFSEWNYWGKPVPGFGDPDARLLIVGLAPAAHGSNRTGRMFTGDVPGGASVWLMRSLFRNGFSNQAESLHTNDGLRLISAWMTAAVRCAPPHNRPLSEEFEHCLPYLVDEFRLLTHVQVVVALGRQAFEAMLRMFAALGEDMPKPKPAFRHGKMIRINQMPVILCSYHPSRQNTNTGRLSESMLDAIFHDARQLCDLGPDRA